MLDVMVPSRGPLSGLGRKGQSYPRLTPLPCATCSPFVPVDTPCSCRVLNVNEERCSRHTTLLCAVCPPWYPMVPQKSPQRQVPAFMLDVMVSSRLGRKRERCSKQTPARLSGFAPLVPLGATFSPQTLDVKGRGVQTEPPGPVYSLVPLAPR